MADGNSIPVPIRFSRDFFVHKITWEFKTADEVDRFTQAVMALFREPEFVAADARTGDKPSGFVADAALKE